MASSSISSRLSTAILGMRMDSPEDTVPQRIESISQNHAANCGGAAHPLVRSTEYVLSHCHLVILDFGLTASIALLECGFSSPPMKNLPNLPSKDEVSEVRHTNFPRRTSRRRGGGMVLVREHPLSSSVTSPDEALVLNLKSSLRP